MANIFDQFDAAPASAPASSGNIFDQFDAPAPSARAGSRATRAPSDVANPFKDEGEPSFDERFKAAPMASATDISTGLGAGLRREADEMLVGEPNAQNIAAAGTLRAINTAGLNIPRALGSAMQSLPLVGNGQGYSQNYSDAKDREEAYARQAPYAAGLGTATGIVGGALAFPSIQAAKGAGILGRSAANAATGAGYAAASELIDNQDLGKAAEAGAIGGVAGGLLTPVAEQAVKGVQALARSSYFSRGGSIQSSGGELTKTARAVLAREGIKGEDLTPELEAQIIGTFARKGETPAAAREAIAGEFGIPLSRGQATGDAAALDLEAAALAGERGTKARSVGEDFASRQAAAIDAARQQLAERAGRGVKIDNPTQAAEIVADEARGYSTRATQEAEAAERQAQDALTRLRGANPLDQVDAGARVRQGIVDEAGAAKGRYQDAYRGVEELPGEFTPEAVQRFGSRVEARLGPDEFIDPVLAPMASRFLADIKNAPTILKLGEGEGASAQQIEQLRKRASLYWQGAAQNPSDRRQLGLIRDAFDAERQAAAETGLFGARAPQAPAAAAVDDFPGFALSGLPDPAAAIPAGAPEPMGRFMARNGGLQLTDDARAADLNRAYYPGAGTLARQDGIPLDQWRVKLVEAGYLPAEASGGMAGAGQRDTANEIMEALRAERTGAGQARYRMDDEARIGGQKALDRVSSENADNAVMVDRQARRIAIDMEGFGYRPQDLDKGALSDAAEAMVRGEVDDVATAYERAVARRAEAVETGRAAPAVADDAPFPELGEGFTPAPAGSALPVATPEGQQYAEATRLARSLFKDYRTKFAPQGAGDDVGLAMRKIVDRNAEPVEVSRMLYAGSPGLNLRIADRIKTTLGEQSEAWAAHQQGFLSSVINGRDMSASAVSERINTALTGEKRALAFKVLTDEQVSGLRQFQSAARQAQAAREAVPDWVATLGRTDFDPNRVTGDLFGSGIPGSRPGSASYATALKKFVGEDSEAWLGLRQAAWRRLVETSDGSAGLAPRVMAQRIREFTDGKGAGLARRMFSPEELAEFRRFGASVQAAVKPDGSARPNGGGKAGMIAGKALDGISALLAAQAGGLPAGAAVFTGRFGTRLLQDGVAARAARRSFEGGAPTLSRSAGPVLDLKAIGIGSGLATEYGL